MFQHKRQQLIVGLFCLFCISVLGVYAGHQLLLKNLPSIEQLHAVRSPAAMRIYTKEGDLIAELDYRRHQFVPIKDIPDLLIQAVLATEDQRFFRHKGTDLYALLRAAFELLMTGQKSQGGSTITMQVARNFYLSREKTFLRKFKEIMLARKIERTFSKDKILELYFNKIYMGNRVLGIGAASQFYMKKCLNQLNLAEIALLAGLPKAPSAINPLANLEAARKRRNFVLSRMYQKKVITQDEYKRALDTPVAMPEPDNVKQRSTLAPYISDMVKEEVHKHLGWEGEFQGCHVYTTIETNTQKAANILVKEALLNYDKRHGYRGPERYLGKLTEKNLPELLENLQDIPTINGLQPALVIEQTQETITALLGIGLPVEISKKGWEWILKQEDEVLESYVQTGDVIRVSTTKDEWCLEQLPEVQSALVALSPKDGAIKALLGGFDYKSSQFNRAIRATRQPGSTFKPLIYAAALEKGFTLADVLNDAPLVFSNRSTKKIWRPHNVTQSFAGLTRLRTALIRSKNLVTVRLLQTIGIPYALKYIERFGFDTHKWPHNLTLALGSKEISPLEMARSYAIFANGGYQVQPYLINRIEDSKGRLLYRTNPKIAFQQPDKKNIQFLINPWGETHSQNYAPHVVSSEITFLIHSVLQDVLRYSANHLLETIKRLDLAGKTGTTNDKMDSWFIVYNSELVSSGWIGCDTPKPLGEYAHTLALPLGMQFMQTVLKETPEKVISQPEGIRVFPIDPHTGERLDAKTKHSLDEYFQSKDVDPIQSQNKTFLSRN